MKNLLIFVILGLFVAITGSGVIGCGGGSSGSTGTNATNGSTGGVTCTALDPANSTILGQIVQSHTTTGIPGVIVKFVNSGNVAVAQATTRSDGCFEANVPVNAVRFQLNPGSISNSYLKLYLYNTKWYSATISSCTAVLPTIVPGTVTVLPFSPIALPLSTSTPPFPNGCVP